VVSAVEGGRLAEARLRDAAARVDALADAWVVAGHVPPAPSGTVVDAAAAFRLSAHAREWLGRSGSTAIVQVDTGSNLAVGLVPWGPASVGAAVGESDPVSATRVAVVGRALAPAHPAWDVAARLSGQGKDVVVVECGWPRTGAEPDIVTWGGSPEVARALVALIGQGDLS
jgi:beta-N-acetylhexosaminidase